MQRGDVVQLQWPFSDQSGSKFRPAIVVQADYLDGIIDDTILVRVTSKIHGITGTEVILDPVQEPASAEEEMCCRLFRHSHI
jgi:mRNA-degrading endonuclease toxin of MazEF toxin-antitoxin module